MRSSYLDGERMVCSRRKYLALLTVGVTGMGGCTSATGDETMTETTEIAKETRVTGTTERESQFSIGEISMVNKHREAHQFHVLVLDGETPVLWRSYWTEKPTYEDGRVTRTTGTIWENSVSEPGRYAVYARIDNRTEWTSWKPDDEDFSCINLEIQLESSERLNLQYSYCE